MTQHTTGDGEPFQFQPPPPPHRPTSQPSTPIGQFLAQPSGKVFALAFIIAIGTVIIAVWNVNNSYGTPCGGWLTANNSHAEYEDAKKNTEIASIELGQALAGDSSGLAFKPSETAQVDACAEARSSRTAPVALGAIIAALLFLAGFIMRTNGGPRIASAGPRPTQGPVEGASVGWQPDPNSPNTERWWNGVSWTDATRPTLPPAGPST